MEAARVKSDLNNDNTAATITLGGLTNRTAFVRIFSIHAGYSANPAAVKRLTVTVAGSVEYAMPFLAGGGVVLDFQNGWGIEVGPGQSVVVTLPASGTGGTVGDLTVVFA